MRVGVSCSAISAMSNALSVLSNAGFFLFLLIRTRFANRFLQIEFLPVYKPSEEEKANPQTYANNVRAVRERFTSFRLL